MKTCPICQAVAFDDAQTCFGCMHRFVDDVQDVGPEALETETRNYSFAPDGGKGAGYAVPPAFTVMVAPELDMVGGVSWTCSVNFVEPQVNAETHP